MQQPIHVAKGPLHTKVILPGSKSMTLRALLLASLADGVSEISGMHISEDVRTFVNALSQLGIVTQLDEKARSCIIAGGNGKCPKKQATLWCRGIRTITNFLLAMSSATPGVFYFDGLKRLRNRSFASLLEVLSRQGIQLIPSDAYQLPFTLIGCDTLEGGEVKLSETTGHFISALLMIAPYARSPFNFNLGDSLTQPYIDMTCAMMSEYGVLVHRIHQGQLMVPVPQRYQAKDYVVEPDLGIASYFFAAAAITGGEVTIQHVRRTQSKQPDANFLTILEKMGCHIQESHAGLTVKGPQELQSIEISLRVFSDTFLALAAMAPFAKSPIRIAHIGPIKNKEMKRFNAIKIELTKMGIHVETGSDWIKIFPGPAKGGIVNTHQDPHVAMALAVMGLRIPDIVLDNSTCLTRFFPDFFPLWEKLIVRSNINA